MRKRLVCALVFLWGASLLFSGILKIVGRIGTDGELYFELQMQAGILDSAGVSEETLKTLDGALARYLRGGTYALETDSGEAISAEVFGETQPAFNNREMAHMRDCQRLFLLLIDVMDYSQFASKGLLIAAILLFFFTPRGKRPSKKQLMLSAGLAPLALMIPLGAFAIWAAADFGSAFTFFHHLLFTNDLWLLNPRTDLLIRICPESMFAKMGMMIGGQALIRTVEYLLISELAFFGAFWLGKKFEEYMK